MPVRNAPYLNVDWLSRLAQVDQDLGKLLGEVETLCRDRPLGRNVAWCGELLAACIAINESRERIEAMFFADGWRRDALALSALSLQKTLN